jgi:hypothetical protein
MKPLLVDVHFQGKVEEFSVNGNSDLRQFLKDEIPKKFQVENWEDYGFSIYDPKGQFELLDETQIISAVKIKSEFSVFFFFFFSDQDIKLFSFLCEQIATAETGTVTQCEATPDQRHHDIQSIDTDAVTVTVADLPRSAPRTGQQSWHRHDTIG